MDAFPPDAEPAGEAWPAWPAAGGDRSGQQDMDVRSSPRTAHAEPAGEAWPERPAAGGGWSGQQDRDVRSFPRTALVIDCDDCVARHSAACDDCVVTFICSRQPDEAVIIDVEEARALRLLSDGGLVPRLRHQRRTG